VTALSRDLHFAIRTLRRSPLFCLVATASLALGIGANTAMFSLIHQLLLELLPVKHPEQLVFMAHRGPKYGSNTGWDPLAYPTYVELRDHNQVLSGMFGTYDQPFSLTAAGKTERVSGEYVSGSFFPVLGVTAAVGRVLSWNDDLHRGAHPVAVLSYGYWQSRFASDPAIIGQKVLVNNYPMTIVGVSQKGFDGLDTGRAPQIRVPLMMKQELQTIPYFVLGGRLERFVNVFGRLKPGVSIKQAQAGLQPLAYQIRARDLRDPDFAHAARITRERYQNKAWLELTPAMRGRSGLRETFRNPLLVLMGVVAFVLLIACANVANLMLARAAARQKEVAVRLALGAGRWAIIRQLLVESLLLFVVAGAGGLAIAFLMNRALIGFIPQGQATLTISAAPDWTVFGFNLAISMVTGILFGLAPALQATRPGVGGTLKDQAAAVVGGGMASLRKALVVAQVTLSLMLLIGAGLFVSTLNNLRGSDPGFRIERLITFKVNPTLNGYSNARAFQFYQNLNDRLNQIPGVRSASLAVVSLLDNDHWDSSMTVEGFAAKPGDSPDPNMNYVAPNLFATLGTPILMGRDFTANDVDGAPKVAIVNRKFAAKYLAGVNPIGHRIGMGGDPGTKTDITIVGVVGDTKYENLRRDIPVEVYIPYRQLPIAGQMTAYVRTERDPEQIFASVRRAIHDVDANLPLYDMRTLEEQVERSLSTERLVASLSTVFGALATFLAAIGLYGVLAYSVTRRTREIGIRMALGADRGRVIWLVMREVLTLLAVGMTAGLAASWALSQFVASQLYGVSRNDPRTITAAIAGLLLISALAAYAPGRRATRIHPMEALRWE
jgi:predicted permease